MTSDADSPFAWSRASLDDVDAVVALMGEFYVEEHLPYDATAAAVTVASLLADASLGAVFLLRAADASVHGYVVATFGFSLEFGGRFVLLDELYLRPSARGRGIAPQALAIVEQWGVAHGVAAVRLEVNHHNARALAIYLKAGFRDDQRHLLTKRPIRGE